MQLNEVEILCSGVSRLVLDARCMALMMSREAFAVGSVSSRSCLLFDLSLSLPRFSSTIYVLLLFVGKTPCLTCDFPCLSDS